MKKFGEYDNIFIIGDETRAGGEEEKKAVRASIKTQIEVKCFKWLGSFVKDKYADFFDYESKSFYLRDYKIASMGTIVDYFKVFQFLNEEVSANHSSDLFNQSHSFIEDNIVVSQSSLAKDNDLGYLIHYNRYAYIVCKYLDNNNPILRLMENDILRIGKYHIEIKLIQIEGKQKEAQVSQEGDPYSSNEKDDRVCRICLRGRQENNTFVSPCNCKGTLKYYHPICLIQWIKSKIELKFEYVNPFCYYILLRNFNCEICKSTYPFTCISSTNEIIYLLQELEKKQSIMILKTTHLAVTKEPELCPYDEYVMLDFSNRYRKEISVGRGRTSLYQLNDISISRNHCSFILENGEIRVKDCQSKFGTLIKMREDMMLSKDNVTVTLQKGNSAYHFVYHII